MDQIRRLTPVSVEPESGEFCYATLNGAKFNVSKLVQARPSFGRTFVFRWSQAAFCFRVCLFLCLYCGYGQGVSIS